MTTSWAPGGSTSQRGSRRFGLAISGQSAITALRYPSTAAARRGLSGWNVAIYPASLETPDRVEILGRSEVPLEVLP